MLTIANASASQMQLGLDSNRVGGLAPQIGQDERSMIHVPFTTISHRRNKVKELYEEWYSDVWVPGKDPSEKRRRERRKFYRRVTGGSVVGLPTYRAEELYIAAMYFSYRSPGFNVEENQIVIPQADLMNLMRWHRKGDNYELLERSLKQLVAVRISTNALFSNTELQFLENLDFGILQSYGRTSVERQAGEVYLRWNQDLLGFYQQGRFKPLDVEVFFSLPTPTAKRLYRWADSNLYGCDDGVFEIDVLRLAKARLGIGANKKYASEVRPALERALDEVAKTGMFSYDIVESSSVSGSGKKVRFTVDPSFGPSAKLPSGPSNDLSTLEMEALQREALQRMDSFNRARLLEGGTEAKSASKLLDQIMREILQERRGTA
jgi:hypothetical protein